MLLAIASGLTAPAAAGAVASPRQTDQPPVFAYYYIWFDPSSWNRAKSDYPLLGRYSSDDTTVMRRQIQLAKQAGIDGFIVSWKHTPTLDERLAKLIRVAEAERFKLLVIYQGLDFERRPLPIGKVATDLDLFSRRFAASPVFDAFGKPVVIWSGSWEFSRAEMSSVIGHRRDLQILASEHTTGGYRRLASLVDGNAYYWSSVNPDTFPGYRQKLREMGAAVHRHSGLWIAPAAPGFDARLIGGHTVVPRADGETLRREYEAAVSSSPDAVGLISWNEFSENSAIEPSRQYGAQALRTLADLRDTKPPTIGDFDSSAPAGTGTNVLRGLATVAGFLVLTLGGFLVVARRRRRGSGIAAEIGGVVRVSSSQPAIAR